MGVYASISTCMVCLLSLSYLFKHLHVFLFKNDIHVSLSHVIYLFRCGTKKVIFNELFYINIFNVCSKIPLQVSTLILHIVLYTYNFSSAL